MRAPGKILTHGYEQAFGADGLTKREIFAAMAMQGLIASKAHSLHFRLPDDATYCVGLADALIAELNK